MDHVADEVHEQPEEAAVDDEVVDAEVFLECPELKLPSHGRKVQKFGRPAAEIEGLFPFPVGEVTITLDDVASLLHLPITSVFYSFKTLHIDEAVLLLVELLEAVQCHGAYVRLSLLRDIYHSKCDVVHWTIAAQAYLLHLVGCTLFANKIVTHVHVVFLNVFRDLTQSGSYAWGTTTLVHMYDNLNDASKSSVRQLAGYITLLQCWIYEHFPFVVEAIDVEDYHERKPRVCRWKSGKALPALDFLHQWSPLLLEDQCKRNGEGGKVIGDATSRRR
ncbi:Protein MAIN-LIKE 2 [Glycine max]|nr:Protein MAIN-LIKE 2 [Glycine max]